MQHHHAGIEPEFAGADPAHDPVEVGMVVEAEPPDRMHDLDPLLYVRVVDADVVGVVDHERRGPLRRHRTEGLHGCIALLLKREGDYIETGRRGGRRVAGMRPGRS